MMVAENSSTEPKRTYFPLWGRLFIQADLRLVTGLHIGGSPAGIEIGGMNNPIIRNPLNGKPYLPGSSLRGKIRSLLEKYDNLPFNQRIQDIYIHGYDEKTGDMSEVCYIFGVHGNAPKAEPTRLFIRDVNQLFQLKSLDKFGADQQPVNGDYTEAGEESRVVEVKWEASIDRVTSAAVPRQQERISAGLVFRGAELVYNFYSAKDYERLAKVLLGMRLLEDDYLGGSGGRGSGKVAFEHLNFIARRAQSNDPNIYQQEQRKYYRDINQTLGDLANLRSWIEGQIPPVSVPTDAGN